jgi:hypothetical protein
LVSECWLSCFTATLPEQSSPWLFFHIKTHLFRSIDQHSLNFASCPS